MNENTRNSIYQEKEKKYSIELSKHKKRSRILAYSRAIIIIALLFVSYKLSAISLIYSAISFVSFSLVFAILVKKNNREEKQISYLKRLIEINQNEQKALKGDYSVFESGENYIDPNHYYSYDLDLFGDGSIYQMLNRTGTIYGSSKLASFLKEREENTDLLIEKQKAVEELKENIDFRQDFHAKSKLTKDKSNYIYLGSNKKKPDNIEQKELSDWLSSDLFFSKKKYYKTLLIILPIISFSLLTLSIAKLIPSILFFLFAISMISIAGFHIKRINKKHNLLSKKSILLAKYIELLKAIESNKFSSSFLQKMQNDLKTNSKTASQNLAQLKSLLNALDNRYNFVFYSISNALYLWDLQYSLRLEKWQTQFAEDLPKWFTVIANFEALSSLSCFAYNNPNYTFPKIKNTLSLKIEQAGHPLIDEKTRVNNDFSMNNKGEFALVTGANMAGKSTFMRTIGVNLILANCGSVVCATKMEFMPVDMFTSVRTNDSLQNNESYFFAELKRLKAIMERVREDKPLFVIIDEMLRGTNSKDKHKGSEAIVIQLVKHNVIGMLATHDIGLGKLAEKFPNNLKNYRFEVEIENDQLQFDYKLKTGISQNLNATFLMKKMGIISQ